MADIHKIDKITSPKATKKIPIDILCIHDDESLDLDDDGTPLRPIFCLKRKYAIKELDDKEDCFILDFNPEDDDCPVDLSNVNNVQDSPDLFMVAEKGKVACRDYPHSRHFCVKHPFAKTPHESYCGLCYCYVCDVAAPCKSWSGPGAHCHAIDTEGWKFVRKQMKNLPKP